MQKKRLLIIPARSGSKRIKNKNIKLFSGKPIISYPIKAARESKLFEKIHVSTDSIKIAKMCKKIGVNIDFLRPKKLSGDKVSLFDVLKFVRDEYKMSGKIFDEIWCILPASPLLNSKDLMIFAKHYHNKKGPMILGSPYPAPLNWRFEIKNNLVKNPNLKEMRNLKLSKKKFFYDSGQVYCFNNSYLDKKDFDFNDKIFIHQLPLEKSVDIDTIDDWNFAEILFRGLTK
jgi:CMP-N-acetylneuraminic acid synthetase